MMISPYGPNHADDRRRAGHRRAGVRRAPWTLTAILALLIAGAPPAGLTTTTRPMPAPSSEPTRPAEPAQPAGERSGTVGGDLALARARTKAFPLRRLPWSRRHVLGTEVATSFPFLTRSGVCMDNRVSPAKPHPVAAAHCGQRMWNNYRLTGRRSWLDKAATQAEWLVSFRREYRDAWFFPYLWDHRLGPSRTVDEIWLRAPWYSAMAQGEALSLFTRLAESTGEARWRTAADATFASLLVAPRVGRPWASWIHDGYLWLEETTFADTPTGDRIFNGHMFALFGVYDYWMLTGSEQARSLARAALTTSLVYADRLRRPRWRSYYDDHRRGDSWTYHDRHVTQLLYLGEMTGDPAFTRAALRLWNDAQPELTRGRVTLTGRLTAYRRDGDRMIPTRTVALHRPSSAPLAWRYRIRGSSAMWLRIGSGPFAGRYLPERAGQAYVRGPVGDLPLRLRLATSTRGPVTRYRSFDPGRATFASSVDVAGRPGTRLVVDRFAIIDGAAHLRVAGGRRHGTWVGYRQVTG